jgi:hypothetical protein
MRLRAFELVEGGAVLLDESTGYPLPLPPGYFRDVADAKAFVRWQGTGCADIRHLRESARRWARVRGWAQCADASCSGRAAPGQAHCDVCLADAEFARTA